MSSSAAKSPAERLLGAPAVGLEFEGVEVGGHFWIFSMASAIRWTALEVPLPNAATTVTSSASEKHCEIHSEILRYAGGR